jgi:TonB family protein
MPSISLASLPRLLYDAAMKRWIYPVVVIAALPLFLMASEKPTQQDSLHLLEQAVAKTNIFELPSFAMKASVQVDVHEKIVDGTYQLLWNGPDQWKEEISFTGYQEIQVGGKGVVWVQRNTDFIPFAVFNLHRALGFGSSEGSPPSTSLVRLDFTPKDTIAKTRERKEHGEKLTCIEILDELKHTRETCIRDSTGTLARASSSDTKSDLQPVGAKVFPRVLSFVNDGRTLAKVNISELVTGAQFPPETFTPAAGVSPQAGCMNPLPARLAKKENPHYPESARSRRIQGTTATQVTIGIDGVPRIRKVVESPSPDLEASSLAAIQQWRYDPALCNGQPVEMETILQVNYSLSY